MIRLARVRRAHVVVTALLASGCGLAVANRPLASAATGADLLGVGARVSVTGSTLAPAYPALLSACAAAALALAFAGRWLRVVVAAALLVGGVAAEIAWRVGLTGAPATLGRVATVGVSGGQARDVQVSTTLALAGDVAAVIVALVGAAALVAGAHWSGVSSRYDAVPGGGREPRGRAGAKPTQEAAAPTAQADLGGPPGATGASRGDPSHGPARPVDDWEALSRGEDPTL